MGHALDAAIAGIMLIVAGVVSVIWLLSMLDRRPISKREWISLVALWVVVTAFWISTLFPKISD